MNGNVVDVASVLGVYLQASTQGKERQCCKWVILHLVLRTH